MLHMSTEHSPGTAGNKAPDHGAEYAAFGIAQPDWEWSKDPAIWPQQFKQALAARGFRQDSKAKKLAAPKKRKRTARPLPPPACWEEDFARTLPYRPRCADDFELGVYPVRREIALGYRYLQYNTPSRACWLISDIDHAGAADAWRAGQLPMPSLIMENLENEHAHMAWRLASPVSCSHPLSKPLRFLSAIERGYTRRLDADMAFSMNGLIKNAVHSAWHVTRLFDGSYSLNELARPLGRNETKLWTPSERIAGLGRNVSLFDDLRMKFAYHEVLRFQAEGDFGGYSDHLQEVADGLNRSQNFAGPLSFAEVRGIVKSVAKWTWARFSPEAFSERQRQHGIRGMAKRWAGHTSLDESRPWEAEGISRRTWFSRRSRAGNAQVDSCTITISGNGGLRGQGATVSNPRLSTANALPPQQRFDRAEQIASNTLSARIFAPSQLERTPA